MAYQLFYGNPFIPGMGEALFQAGRNETLFARAVETAKLGLEQRRLRLQATQQQMEDRRATQDLALRREQVAQSRLQFERELAFRQSDAERARTLAERAQANQSAQFGQELGFKRDDLALRRQLGEENLDQDLMLKSRGLDIQQQEADQKGAAGLERFTPEHKLHITNAGKDVETITSTMSTLSSGYEKLNTALREKEQQMAEVNATKTPNPKLDRNRTRLATELAALQKQMDEHSINGSRVRLDMATAYRDALSNADVGQAVAQTLPSTMFRAIAWASVPTPKRWLAKQLLMQPGRPQFAEFFQALLSEYPAEN